VGIKLVPLSVVVFEGEVVKKKVVKKVEGEKVVKAIPAKVKK
jgi:hypothetical protein